MHPEFLASRNRAADSHKPTVQTVVVAILAACSLISGTVMLAMAYAAAPHPWS